MLDAAWEEIIDRGYSDLTVDSVAVRAGTSKAVLYRRWAGKAELVRAAVEHVLARDPMTMPDTGTLRGDVIAALRQINERRVGLATHLIASLGEFYRETGTSLASLRDTVAAGQDSLMSRIVQRAVERGELPPDTVPDRIVRLPTDLLRLEMLMSPAPVPDEELVDIVDAVFLPLVMRR